MRITIFAAGSRGDIQPCVVLGKALQQAGYEILLAAPENFADFVSAHGLRFYPLRGDVQQVMASDAGREFMEEGGANFLQTIRAMRTMLGPIATQMAEDLLNACQGADALISLAVFAALAQTVADVKQIPLIHVEPTPVLPTRAFPAPGWPIQKNLGALHNWLSGHAMLQVLWQWYAPFVNDFRRRQGLQPFSAAGFYRSLKSAPLLGAYSPEVIPRPADWPPSVHITGYWFLDSQPNWQPSSELQAFLEAGDAPVYVGFGSMAGRRPDLLAQVVLEALGQSGRRGLLLTGWGGMQALKVPATVFVLPAAPHGWLFPRMAAVVHHGGAGTTAEGLRAGVPTVILPFAVDQAFWGRRVQKLGVGPEPIPFKQLTAGKLADAIQQATGNTNIKRRAAELGAAIRSEDGAAEAVKRITQYLG